MNNYFFTSESVSCGHPDKVCDQISDAILDEFLAQDSDSKVAVECFITNNMLVIGGEAHSKADVDIIGTAKRVIKEIGYNSENGFDPESAVFVNTLHEQSSDIRQGVDLETEIGAGDQGIMFGYACDETDAYMPLPIYLANKTMEIYDRLRKNGELPGCRPDAKCQYTVEYDGVTGNPLRVSTILISMQHDPDITEVTLREYFTERILPAVKAECKGKKSGVRNGCSRYFEYDFQLLVNPTGRFVIGGPQGDTGLTGRKIIVDTYGGRCPHGGGAFSGKDCTKVDRSAAYGARFAAKLLVAAGIAKEITIQLSYAIGVAKPLSIYVDAKPGEYNYPNEVIAGYIASYLPVTPQQFFETFGLNHPIFSKTATYGHFGNPEYPWEQIPIDTSIQFDIRRKMNEIADEMKKNS